VIARNTAFTYKGKPVDVKQIGRELGVRYVLEGSVRRTGHQVRVNVQLVDAETGAHLWADRFDTNRVDLAEAQDAITGRLARTLNIELVEDAGRRIERERMADPDASDLVMYGRALFNRPHSVATFQEAQRAYEQALEKDPGLVDAKVGIASVLLSKIANGDRRRGAAREEIQRRVRDRSLRLLVATDAASEGLNLQRLETLINVDLPWNPARLEQRKGRIDRIGQLATSIDILNLRYRGSVEDQVHQVLSARLEQIREIFGTIPDTLEDVWVERMASVASPVPHRLTSLT
jgi:hypothetical protein